MNSNNVMVEINTIEEVIEALEDVRFMMENPEKSNLDGFEHDLINDYLRKVLGEIEKKPVKPQIIKQLKELVLYFWVSCESDENLISFEGPGNHLEVMLLIIRFLKMHDVYEKIKEGLFKSLIDDLGEFNDWHGSYDADFDYSCFLRGLAVELIAEFEEDKSKAVALFEKILFDPSGHVFSTIIAALKEIGTDEAVELLFNVRCNTDFDTYFAISGEDSSEKGKEELELYLEKTLNDIGKPLTLESIIYGIYYDHSKTGILGFVRDHILKYSIKIKGIKDKEIEKVVVKVIKEQFKKLENWSN